MLTRSLALLFVATLLPAADPPKPTPDKKPVAPAQPRGDAKAGKEVFRFETFGNEGFWTDAARLPQGMKADKITPLQLLETGFHIDADALPADLRTAFGDEFKTDHSPAKAPKLNDPAVSEQIVQANALIGVVPKGKKVGIACALCHTITDGSVLQMEGKGSVGKRLDGRAPHSLDVGKALSVAANSRAFYPILQLELGGKTIGRAPKGLTKDSTEKEVDAYLTNKEFWPRGTHDDTPDGIGNSIQIAPLFRQDLAAPFGSNGLNERLDGFDNLAYTVLLDPTTLATPEGREFLVATGGKNGQELYDNYVAILKETGVTGYPYVQAEGGFKAGHRDHPTGRMVDAQKLADFSAYVRSLPAPPGAKVEPAAAGRGRKAFAASCANCHQPDPDKPVDGRVIELKDVWPGYKPEKLADRKPPLSPIENSPGTFDDKMVVVDASERGEKRGVALPLLLDLARKPRFLHDDSVASLDALLDPKRGKDAPHPFYAADAGDRAALMSYLQSLGPADDTGRPADPLKPGKPNADMRAVLDALADLKPKPITDLSPDDARKQPSAADAVKALLKKKGKPTDPEAVGGVKDVTFRGGKGELPARVYTPKGDGPFPVLVYWHGGGFVLADLDTYDASCRALCNAAGCLVVSCEYRHAPEYPHPAQGEDAFAAYQWVLKNAADWKGDPKRVAVGGESAGGNLAANVAIMARDKKVQAPVHQLLVYPVTDNDLTTDSYKLYADAKPLNKPMMVWFFAHTIGNQRAEQVKSAFPLKADLKDLPPATLVNAEVDPLRDDGRRYADTLEKAGVKVKRKVFDGVTHEFFGMGAVLPDAKKAVEFAADELKAAFKK